jgi:two-component system, OmpR family, sensor kinase
MFLKSSVRLLKRFLSSLQSALSRLPAHSLRLRLMVWYSVLMLLVLSCFGLLVSILVAHAVNTDTQSAISTETQIAAARVRTTLSAQPPYWPARLQMQTLNTYTTPGIMIEVLNNQGQRLYSSDPDSTPNLKSPILQTAHLSTNPIWYTINVDGGQAIVGATAIYAPATSQSTNRIGVLLVAKSLADENAMLLLLRSLLFLTGLVMLILFLVCGWVVVGYTLRPLANLVEKASSIATSMAYGKRTGGLRHSVKQPGGGDELSQVINAFNNMLISIEDATALQRRFIADASHELRAPLTTIQGNLAFLIRYIEDIPPAERHTMLADAHGETLRLANLVDELLLLARADANLGESPQLKQPAPLVELDRTLLKLVRQMRRRLEIEGSTLKIEIGGIEPVRVRGDEESLRRIMIILLDNAIKYTRAEEDKDEGGVTVALERINNEAVLSVSDTGIGIESKDLPHIFERFYRADLARSREGTGLGLAIAQTLIEQLDGRITAESQPGQGSTFRVWLSLA